MAYDGPDTEETLVLFRCDKSGPFKDVVDAVFPYEPGTNDPRTMSCYAHVGQHGSCDMGWLRTTRPAKPEEYADLKAELEGAPYGYRFKVRQRMPTDAYRVRLRPLGFGLIA